MHQALSLLIGTPEHNPRGWRGFARGTTMSARTSPSAKHLYGGNGQPTAARQGDDTNPCETNPCDTKPCGRGVAKPPALPPVRAGSAVLAASSGRGCSAARGRSTLPRAAALARRERSRRACASAARSTIRAEGHDRAKDGWRRRAHEQVSGALRPGAPDVVVAGGPSSRKSRAHEKVGLAKKLVD